MHGCINEIRRSFLNWMLRHFVGKLYAHGFAELYVVVCVSEFSGQFVASEHLNHVAVAARYKQILAVWSDGEIAWMSSCGLKTTLVSNPVFASTA